MNKHTNALEAVINIVECAAAGCADCYLLCESMIAARAGIMATGEFRCQSLHANPLRLVKGGKA